MNKMNKISNNFNNKLDLFGGDFGIKTNLNIKSYLAPSSNGNKEEISQNMQKFSCLSHVLVTLYNLLNFLFISPFYIHFDDSVGKFVTSQSNILKRAFILVLQFLDVFENFGNLRSVKSGNSKKKLLMIIRQAMFLLFIFASLVQYWTIWRNRHKIKKLMDKLNKLTIYFELEGFCLPSKKKVLFLTWLGLGLCIIFSIFFPFGSPIYFVIPRLENINTSFIQEISYPTHIMEMSYDRKVDIIESALGTGEIEFFQTLKKSSKWAVYTIGIIAIILQIYSTFIWLFMEVTLIVWAVMFRHIQKIFIHIFSKCERIAEKLGKYRKISQIIEDFNLTFGVHTFAIILAPVAYVSVFLMEIINESDIFSYILRSLSTLVFFGMLIVCAEVNQQANFVSYWIKKQFKKPDKWTDNGGDSIHVTQSMMIIYHDLDSNNIGITGMNFFTISYAFIGSVISVICTYSVIVLQTS